MPTNIQHINEHSAIQQQNNGVYPQQQLIAEKVGGPTLVLPAVASAAANAVAITVDCAAAAAAILADAAAMYG